MAHYAELDDFKRVIRVVVIDDAVEPTEIEGILWCQQFFDGDDWIKTSYNGRIRKNFAGVGYLFDGERNAFIPPCPGEGWTLDEETCQWVPPQQEELT